MFVFFFFNDTATTEIYTLSLHDALPIFPPALTDSTKNGTVASSWKRRTSPPRALTGVLPWSTSPGRPNRPARNRSEEHTSELQSLAYLVCRLLLEKKKKTHTHTSATLVP